MPKIAEVCRHVRSKNAGPFWITVDFFFADDDSFARYRDAPELGPDLFARLFGTDPAGVKRVPVDALRMIKISYPRPHPQGWRHERDMHGGQQFARLLSVELA
ncbi:DUF4387 domain-containing protein [Nitrospirillum viridazoti]|uniref:DUF4387 domain-containing protein n=2 Tax=Nitrospirillum TaxID=1543705 RepID=A0A248K300_9PROT|nr:DUF4387 domain-containing protein [Nitrospirillum amazonense]ASG25302.1 hypothetical protein Y958_30660 [Nitrospirillum amazonense CBAmc]TWB35386.1 uncharacterized protein DUF4387 [Nitrospirillum amazonense]TWB63935.1 uncharacterized protein DUF4387 [Nitrospirillum amazonense]